MNTLNKYANRTSWFTAIILATLVVGCSSSSSASPSTVTSTDPDDTATSIAINSKVVATFSEAVDATTIDSTSFTVVGADESALTGTASLDANSNSASFTSNSNFTASTLYTATITTATKSVENQALVNDYHWSFTSGTTADMTPPMASSTDPLDAATGFARNRGIKEVRVLFSCQRINGIRLD